MEYFTRPIQKHYVDFEGRTTKKEFWRYILYYFIFYVACLVANGILHTGMVSIIYSLGLLLPTLSITTRRLHDTGRSGWWQLIGIIPLLGLIVMIIFCIEESKEDNQYGPKPVGD